MTFDSLRSSTVSPSFSPFYFSFPFFSSRLLPPLFRPHISPPCRGSFNPRSLFPSVSRSLATTCIKISACAPGISARADCDPVRTVRRICVHSVLCSMATSSAPAENGLWSEIRTILTRDHRTTSHRLVDDRFADFGRATARMTTRWSKRAGASPRVDSPLCPPATFDDYRRTHPTRRSRSTGDRAVRWLSKWQRYRYQVYRSSRDDGV